MPSGPALTPEQARTGFSTRETLTRCEDVASYNNFYEFGTGKVDPSQAARTLKASPWQMLVGGECARPGALALHDLMRGLSPQDRVYRLRGAARKDGRW